MDSAVSLRDEPALMMAYLRRQGPYATIPEAIQVLVTHLQRHRIGPAGPPTAVFHTDPQVVPEAEALWEVRMPVSDPVSEAEPGDDGVGLRRVPSRTLAVMVHIGPYASVAPSYANTQHWIDEHGYTVVGPPEEAYLSPPDTPEAAIRTEIRFPVEMEPVALGG